MIKLIDKIEQIKIDSNFTNDKDFANSIKLDGSKYSKIKKGTRQLQLEDIIQLYRIYNINIEWLLLDKGNKFNKITDNDNFNLLVIGDGPDLYKIKDFAKQNLLIDRFICTGKIKLAELNIMMTKADIGFVTYSYNNLNNINCSPNKIFEYASVGLPMLATDQDVLKKYFKKYNIGMLMDKSIQSNPNDLAKLIINMSDNLAQYQCNLEKFLIENNWQIESKKLINEVGEL